MLISLKRRVVKSKVFLHHLFQNSRTPGLLIFQESAFDFPLFFKANIKVLKLTFNSSWNRTHATRIQMQSQAKN